MDIGAWRAALHGIGKHWIQLGTIADLQCCVNSAVQKSDSRIHKNTFWFQNILFHYGLSQDIE